MRKKILSIMLALCLVLTMMPMATGVAWAGTASSVDIGTVKLNSSNPYYHNGENGSQGYADNDPIGANATFSSGMLTLNGLNLTTSGYAIYATADLTIKLEGKNNVKGGNASNNVIYIGYQSSLTITGPESGTASLTVTGGDQNPPTIYAYNNITINGGAQVTAKNTAGVAINAQHGNIEITGQKTTVICSGKDKNALVAGASESGKTVTVSDSATLVAATTSASLGAIKGTVAIAGGNETIMGGTSESDAASLALDTLNSNSSTYKYVYIDTVDTSTQIGVPTAITGLTYDGSIKTGVGTGEGYSLSGNTATDAGSYTATATLNDGYRWTNGTILDRTIKWSIAKADLNKDFFTFAAPSNCTYDGNAKAAMVTTKDGLTGIGNITAKYYDEAGNKVNEAKNVGTYTVKIDVAEGMNNNAATDLTDSSWTFTIVAPAYDVTITPKTGMTHASGSGLETQTDLTGAMTPVVYNADTGYYFPEGYGSALGKNGITVERVSETQIKISGTPTATTAITLAEPSQHPVKPSISVTGTYTYTGGEQTATVNGYVDATMNITGNKGTNAGTYTVSVTSKTGKWRDGTADAVTASWSISKLGVTITPTSGQHKTYGTADPELTYSTGLSGAAETAFTSAKNGALVRAAGEDAGTYAINIGTLNAGANFTLTLSGSIVNFTIDKATWGIPTETLTPAAPTSAANNDGKITGTTSAMQYKLSSESTWTDCSGDITGIAAGTYYVRYKEDVNHNASESAYKTVTVPPYVAPAYDVTVIRATGMTLASGSGSESQTGLTGAMTPVVYNAATGYYFPEGYGAALGKNGITVERVNETQIKISGTPTATTAITLAEPSQHPVKPSIRVDGTYTYTSGEQTATVNGYVDATMNITGNKGTDAGSYTVSVTSKTGKWRDGTADAVTASWSISKLGVTITPTSGQHKTYGTADLELTYSTGLSGAAETAFNFAKSGKLTRAAGEDAGTYAINIGTLTAGNNFTLTLSGSIVNFTIDKATWGIPTETLTPAAPTSASSNDGRIEGTTAAMQYKLSSESTWKDCSGNVTGLAAGTYYVRYKEDTNHNASESAYKTVTVPAYVAPAYDVTVTRATGMTLASGSGLETQTGLTGAMTPVVYNADTGYYFPEGYGTSLGQNGITVERVSETQIRISGTPTATTTITLAGPSQHPVKPSISVTGTYTYDGGEQTATVTGYAADTMDITGNKGTDAGSYTVSVTSKTGKWSDGTTAAATADWSINPLSITITPASGLNKTYGEADPELTYSTGLSGAAETAFNSAKTGALARAAGEDAGTYAINIGTLTAGNNFTLTLSGTPVSFTIDKATWGVPTETLTAEAPTSAANNDGRITGTTTAMQYKLSSDSTWTDCSGDITGLAVGTYYVRYKEDANHNASESAYKPVTVPAYSTGSSTGGGSYGPTIQKPTIIADETAETTLSAYGDKLTIKVADGYEITDVIVNGVSKGKVTELTGLKTGDKVEIKTEKKAEEPKKPTIEEIKSMLKQSELVCRSKIVVSKNGKKGIRITWADMNGGSMDFDGVEVYRSTKRYKGYGTKPFYETKGGKTEGYYVNTRDLEEGTTYYYKVRGYVMIDGQKYYTDYSLKAIRTLK